MRCDGSVNLGLMRKPLEAKSRLAVMLASVLMACGGASADSAGTTDAGGAGGGTGVDAATPWVCGDDPALIDLEMLDDEGHAHVPPGTQVDYGHTPPASGPHYGAWAASGVYDRAVDPRSYVHNLEHGWLVLLHRPDAARAEIDALEAFWRQPPADPHCPDADAPRVLVSPAPGLRTPVAALTWTRVLAAESLSRDALAAFFRDCRAQAPEIRVCADGREPAFLEGE